MTAVWLPRLVGESHAQGEYDNAEPILLLAVRIADDVLAGRGGDGFTEREALRVRMSLSSVLVAKVGAQTSSVLMSADYRG